jgi:hypothetical protein
MADIESWEGPLLMCKTVLIILKFNHLAGMSMYSKHVQYNSDAQTKPSGKQMSKQEVETNAPGVTYCPKTAR